MSPDEAMVRTRFDQLGKNVLRDALLRLGDAQTETEVPPGDAQRIDLWFVPDQTRQRAGPGATGLLGALAEAPALIELWSSVPDERAFHACLRKRYTWHHGLELRDKRDWAMPELWGLSAGRPEGLLVRFGFEPAPDGPTGHYRMAAPALQARMIVISELPRVRDTVLLRLLGSRAVRRAAIRDLAALSPDAWERGVALPWLVRLGFEVQAADPSTVSSEEMEFSMDMEVDVHAWFAQFQQDLLAKGRQEGLAPLVHQFERRLGRALTPEERSTLADRLHEQGAEKVGDAVLDLPREALAAWLTPSAS